MKTARTIPAELFKKARAKELLYSLNKAYADVETPEEAKLRKNSKLYYSAKILNKDKPY